MPAHSLTTVQIEFSHDDSLMLSVSRDRHWALTTVREEAEGEYVWRTPFSRLEFLTPAMRCAGVTCEVVQREKAHARIIWSCSWAQDDSVFVTGSRDKKVTRLAMCDACNAHGRAG